MNANLALMQMSIAAAQKHLANLKGCTPEDLLNLAEIDDLELGLRWIMKRADNLRDQLETHANRQKMGYANSRATETYISAPLQEHGVA